MTELIDNQVTKNLQVEAQKDAKKPVKTHTVGGTPSPAKKKLFSWISP